MAMHRGRAWILAAAATALLAVTSTPASGAPSANSAASSGHLSANARLTSDKAVLRGHDMPALAVDPSDPNHIVLIEENFLAGQCDFHTSFDGGRTWTDGVLTVPSDFANPPCNTFDSGGYAHFNQSVVFGSGQNVYTTFASHRGLQERPEIKVVQGEGDSIIVNHSTDGGRTFQTGVVAIHGSPMSQPYVIRPGVAVFPKAGGDRVTVVGWSVFVTSGGAQGGGGDRQLVTATSNDGGATWGAPVVASATGEHIREPAPPVVGSDGAIYTAWRNRDDPSTGAHPVVVSKSTDGGATWTNSNVAQMLPSPTGAAHASGYPRLAIDPKSNTVYVTFQNFASATAKTVDQFVSHSTDGGTTWSQPVKVNDGPSSPTVTHYAGRISVAPNGRLDVVWVDDRNAYPTPAALKATPEADIYYASSTDGGQTFSANRRITDRSINLDNGLVGRVGSYIWYAPAIAPLGNDAVEFAWSDSRLGNVNNDNQDIELATLQLNSSAPVIVQSLPHANSTNESIATSLLAYPSGVERAGAAAISKVVIVNQNDPTSALAASVLARANFGPLLLSPASGMTKQLRDEVARLQPTGAYVVGLTSSVPAVGKDLASLGITNVTQVTGATPDDVAGAVAAALDPRTPDDAAKGVPAVPAAVVINPTSPDAVAGAGLAASLRYPILFATRDAIPAATSTALSSLAVPQVLVVGGTAAVSDSTFAQLLGTPKRISGADAAATSVAAASEAITRGVPANILFVADPSRTADVALASSFAARAGGLLVLAPHADATLAQSQIDQLHLGTHVDQVVVVQSKSSPAAHTVIIVISIVLAALGLILLLAALTMRSRNRQRSGAESTGAPTPSSVMAQ
jgi:putative cell wall-binding protein